MGWLRRTIAVNRRTRSTSGFLLGGLAQPQKSAMEQLVKLLYVQRVSIHRVLLVELIGELVPE